MKTIKWELPFKTIDYLQSLTEDLINNPSVILITGVQNEEGEINHCNISLKEIPGVDLSEAILYIGAAIGAHSVDYSIELKEKEEAENNSMKILQETFGILSEASDKGEPIAEEEEEMPLKETKDTKAKAMLRRILKNFKKSII